ncbi:TlpA family protein disulfide reductase [Halocola ammonii]
MTKLRAFALLAAPLFFFACGDSSDQSTAQEAPKSAVVAGKITNPKNDRVLITGPNDFRDTLKLDEFGSFSGEVSLDEKAEYRFLHGGEYARIFLSPGDSIHLALDTKDFDKTLVFTGDEQVINTYFVNQVLTREKWNNQYPPRTIHELDPNVFVAVVDSMYNEQRENLEQLKNSNLDEELIEREEIVLDFREAQEKIIYEPRRKQQLGVAEVMLPEGYYSFMDELDFNNPKNLEVPTFESFMETYLFLEADKNNPDSFADPAKQMNAMFDVIDEEITNQEIKEELYTGLVLDNIRYRGLNGTEEVMPRVKEVVSDSTQLAEINEELAKWEQLAAGLPAPGFAGKNLDGEEVSLTDMAGSYVYLDVWATWCAPCRMEIPHLEEMQESMKDENIRFVSLSIDEDKEAWKEMVKEESLGGTQLHIGGAEKVEFSKDYLISGIPRFMIFDPQGQIVNVKATRPSMGAEEELRKLLSEGTTAMN